MSTETPHKVSRVVTSVYDSSNVPDFVVKINACQSTQGVNWGWCGISTFVCPREEYAQGIKNWTFSPYLIKTGLNMEQIPDLLKTNPQELEVAYSKTARVVCISRKPTIKSVYV